MKPSHANSLAVNITLVVLLASSVSLVVFTSAMLFFDKKTSTSQLDARLSTLADIVGQNSAAALSFEDRVAARQVLEALRKEPPIVSACLYGVSGSLFAAYYEEQAAGNCPANSHSIVPSRAPLRSIQRLISRRLELVGTIYLVSDLRYLEMRRRGLIELSLLMAMVSLAVGGLAGLLLQKRITHPIARLVQGMHQVTSSATFDVRAEVEGSAEAVELATGFNAMLMELERRDRMAKQAEETLQLQATADALTGLPNRRLFSDRLIQVRALAYREHKVIGLLYIDLDGFKLVNDSLGHSVGDSLLCEVAERFKAHVRISDTLARVGGDEFTVILSSLHEPGDAALAAQSLLSCLAKPFRIDGHDITIGTSIGISILADSESDSVDLLKQADSAMYAAKRSGRNRAMFYTPEMGLMARERLSIENELRFAIERGEIYVAYQPEFSVATGELVRFEALARWKHPTLWQIGPDRFIPVAEESGLIFPLGYQVMERAFEEAVKWQGANGRPIQVAVNMSALQFNSENMLEEVAVILDRTGIDPRLVQIELTESVMVGSIHRSAEKMRKMHELGLSIAIDDFGTGYSCLAYLPELPIDAIKIDRSFTQKLRTGSDTVKMVQSMIDLAHSMEMAVVVEGVEDDGQLNLIRNIGADEVQGYFLGRPGPEPSSQYLLDLTARSNIPFREPALDPVYQLSDSRC